MTYPDEALRAQAVAAHSYALAVKAQADPDNEARIQAAFAELAKGRTVIMIAHRLSTVADADRIFVIEDGKVAESGTRTELCAAGGLFAKMWSDYQASVEWKVAKEG